MTSHQQLKTEAIANPQSQRLVDGGFEQCWNCLTPMPF